MKSTMVADGDTSIRRISASITYVFSFRKSHPTCELPPKIKPMADEILSRSKIAAVFCLTAPHPVTTGTTLRCRSVILWLLSRGYSVVLFYPAGDNLTEFEIAKATGAIQAIALPPDTKFEARIRFYLSKFFGDLRSVSSDYYRPFLLSRLSRKLILQATKDWSFELVITEYPVTTNFSSQIKNSLHIVDTCDLLSVHYRKVARAKELFTQYRAGRSSDFLNPACIIEEDLPIDSLEVSDLYKHDAIIAISEHEHSRIKSLNIGKHIQYIPPCVDTADPKIDYTGYPIFTYSPNIFNLQGIIHFICNLLPEIRKAVPSFRLYVTGDLPEEVPECQEVIRLGFVPDITPSYQMAGYAIIPVFDGTGQQLKVAEAMAHGLTVVGYRKRVDSMVITDGNHGFLADSQNDFIMSVVELWNDVKLRTTMGRSAQDHVKESLSQEVFSTKMDSVVARLSRP
jgi:glycosyltransferase involved in cell wall biosynthesis